jgi:hypothetical protein
MLEEKIRACGVTLKARERRQLLQHVKFNADSISFRRWDFWRDRNFTINFTEEDGKALRAQFTNFLEQQLPGLIGSTIQELAKSACARVPGNRRAGTGTEPIEKGLKILFPFQDYDVYSSYVAKGSAMPPKELCRLLELRFTGSLFPSRELVVHIHPK